MPINKNRIILTAADYKVALTIPGVSTFMLATANSISWNESAENELVYAVGDQYPIGNKNNAYKFTGKLSLQVGELQQITAAAGVVSVIQIPDTVLSICAIATGFSLTFSGICLNTNAVDVKAKDKESVANIDFTALLMV